MTRKFRLATVERLRTARLEAGGRELVAVQTALQAGRERRELVAAKLYACSTPARTTADDLIALAARRDRLRDELSAADSLVAELLEAANRARDEWLTARAELRAVESLHERHRAQVREERLRAEQAEADELAQRSGPGRVGAGRHGGSVPQQLGGDR
jgi:flagellar export protein FliJ